MLSGKIASLTNEAANLQFSILLEVTNDSTCHFISSSFMPGGTGHGNHQCAIAVLVKPRSHKLLNLLRLNPAKTSAMSRKGNLS